MKQIWRISLITAAILCSLAECTNHAQPSLTMNISAQLQAAADTYNQGVDLVNAGKSDDAAVLFRKSLDAIARISSPEARKLEASAANDLGNLLLLKGNLTEAELFFRQAIQSDSKHFAAMNGLGAVLIRQGKVAEAQKAFEDSIKTNPTYVLPLNNLAELLTECGQLKLAAKYLIASLKANPTNQQTLIMLVRIYTLGNLPKERQLVCQTLAKVSGGSVPSKLLLAESYLKTETYAQAEPILKEVLALQPDSLDALRLMAQLKAKTGDLQGAETGLRNILNKSPDNPRVLTDLAAILISQGRGDQAAKLATDATLRFPKVAENWFLLGECKEKLKQDDEATKAYLKAVQLDPNHEQALNNLGVLCAKKDLGKEALSYFFLALKANPYYPDARYNLGRALIITKTDYPTGVRLLAAVGATRTDAGERARKFIAALEKTASSSQPVPDQDVNGIRFPGFDSIKDHIHSPLMLAIMEGDITAALTAVEQATNVNEQIETGITPLMTAASMGQTSVVSALIAKSASLEATNRQGRTALMIAALKGRTGPAKLLVKAGAGVNHRDFEGLTPLMCAVAGGQIEIVNLLLGAGAEVNAQDAVGDTALIKAAVFDWVPAVEALLAHGAYSNLKNNHGRQALDYVHDAKTAEFLRNHPGRK